MRRSGGPGCRCHREIRLDLRELTALLGKFAGEGEIAAIATGRYLGLLERSIDLALAALYRWRKPVLIELDPVLDPCEAAFAFLRAEAAFEIIAFPATGRLDPCEAAFAFLRAEAAFEIIAFPATGGGA
ncbi:hypothetical protein X759_35670 [Mesorhizobium sp. LSHC420B00]|nr:hypothetical protein X759_35670 [Mesorhizobium sp. LSHC420B00]